MNFVNLIKPVANKKDIELVMVDQYTGINSSEFKSFLKKRNIKMIFTAVNSPQSTGLNEGLNQNLVNRIRCKQNAIGEKRT